MAAPTERGEDTRARIIDTAMVLFAERGYDATSMSQILDASATTKGGFYFHFPSKAALATVIVRTVQDQVHAAMVARITAVRAVERLDQVIDAAFDAKMVGPQLEAIDRLCDALRRDAGVDADALAPPYQEWFKITQALLEEAQRDGDVPTTIDPHACAVMAVSTFFGLCSAVELAELESYREPYRAFIRRAVQAD